MNAGLGRTRNAAHSMMAALCVIAVAACAYFVCGRAFQGYSWRPRPRAYARRPAVGLARRRAMVLPRSADERPRSYSPRRAAALLIRMAGRHRRKPRRPHPARQRRRSLAARRHLRIDRFALRPRVPVIRTLDVGRRLARATGYEPRPRTRLPRCRRFGHDPHRGRIDRARDHLDRRPSPRQVFVRRHADGDPGPQCRAGALRMHDRVRRMAGTQLRRRNALRRRGRRPCSADCDEHAARRIAQRRWSRR